MRTPSLAAEFIQPDNDRSPWLTAHEAAERARVGVKIIYSESRAGRLRHAKIGGRRELRFLAAWIDAWLEATSEPVEQQTRTPRLVR
jgi:excisionase family DNA binding protein